MEAMRQIYDSKQNAGFLVFLQNPRHNHQESQVKQEFSIKDLENLTGVKAHTIRAWEQRYELLNPTRSATNIRTYSGYDLKRLLNVSLLVERGMKISKIAELSEEELVTRVRGKKNGDIHRPRRAGAATAEGCHAVLRRKAVPGDHG